MLYIKAFTSENLFYLVSFSLSVCKNLMPLSNLLAVVCVDFARALYDLYNHFQIVKLEQTPYESILKGSRNSYKKDSNRTGEKA